MRVIDLSNVTWRKSSYSNTDGGNCIEVSDDFLSAADWRTSSYSNTDGGECVEFAPNLPTLVPVRDSKNPTHGTLLFGVDAWAEFVESVK
ncbi:protein of unknown function [Streptomyces sp. 3213]|uniref:DUF397 domain-containing protein n=1 Tax=Streptomyces sp. 3213.3 TaxID=1855348 RepID=UPI0008944FE4|nr:DUF397 domain-containing protein [Streptomyces sp. 3213.3]SEE12438.1 protein of unknown function [Streptomyces sp. 3213] [Streptomyces sp. 3213.3]